MSRSSPSRKPSSHGLRRLGLQAALFALALAGLVPVALLSLAGAMDERRDARRRVADDARRTVRSATLRHAGLLRDGPAVLEAVLRVGGTDTDPHACAEQLRSLRAALPHIADLGIVDGRGHVSCRAARTSASADVADQFWFRRAVTERRFAMGEYEARSLTDSPALVMGLPETDGASPAERVAFAAIDPAWLIDAAESDRLPGAPRVTVIDPDGIIVARHPRPEDWVGRPLSDRPRQVILEQRDGTADIKGLDGVRRLYVFAPLGQPPTGYVTVAAPTDKAYAAANAELRRSLILVGLLSVAGVGSARLVGRSLIVKPANAVVNASRRLASGELSTRVEGPRPPGELGEISGAFDEMASALESRDAALQQAGDDLRRHQAQLQAILDNAPAAIFVQDLEGRYLLVNRGFEALTGTPRRAAMGRTDRELFGPEAATPVETHIREVLRTGGAVERREAVPGPDGERTFHALRFPLLGPDEVPYALCGISQDVTDQIRAETERAALEEQVQRGQRLESLGLLAGGVAHDFNNLLSIILSYTEFALESLDDGPVSQAEHGRITEDLRAVLHAARSAAGLTGQLLVFARRDPVESEPEPLDVNHVLSGLKPLLRRTLSEQVELTLECSPQLDPVLVDPVRLEQIVVNLVVNARDAMPQGGRLRVRTEAVTAPSGEGRVRLIVSDTGSGMAPEVVARAFDPFFTTKPKGRGTGLGLATVYGIVTGLGGDISIDSRPGEGTDMIVDLPTGSPLVTTVGDAHAGRASGETVLVVEDEEAVRAVAERITRKTKFPGNGA